MEDFKGLNTSFGASVQEGIPGEVRSVKMERRSKKASSSKVSTIESIIMLVLSVVVFLLPWICTPFTYEFYEITKNTVLIISVILLVTLWAIKASLKKQISLVKTPFDLPILIFLASQIISTVFSIYKQTSIWGYYSRFTGGLISTVTLVLLYYFVVNNINKKEYVNRLVKISTISITLLALFVILKSFNVFNPMFEKLASSHASLSFLTSAIFTPVGTPNALPYLFVLALPILLFFIFGDEEDKALQQIFSITGACICLFAIGITSMASSFDLASVAVWVLVFGVIVGVLILKFPLSNNTFLQLLPVVLVAIFSLIFAFRPQVRDLISKNINYARYPEVPFNTTWAVITGTYRAHKVGGFLVGTGPDTYAYDFPRFRPIEQNLEVNWHQNYTRSSSQVYGLLVESGIIGFLSFAFLIFMAISFIIRKGFKKEIGSMNVILLGSGLSIVVISLSSFVIFFPIVILFYFWLLLGLIVSLYFVDNPRSKETYTFSFLISKSKVAYEGEKEVIPYVFIGVALVFLLTCSYFVTRNFVGEYQYKKALVASYWRDYGKSNDYILGAISKNDKRDYYHRHLAYTGLEALKEILSAVQTEQSEQTDDAQVNYFVSLIKEELNKAVNLNRLDAANWEAAAVIYKQLVELASGKAYGNETLYAAAQAISLNPYNPDNYIILGYIYQFNANEEYRGKAESVFVQAYNMQPSYPLSIFALGNYLEFVQKYQEAINLYQISITNFYPNESDVNTLLNERIQLAEDKLAGVKDEGETKEPTEEDITQEVQDNVIPSLEDEDVKGAVDEKE